MGSISQSSIVVVLTMACLLVPATHAIDCYHTSTIKPCHSTLDTCFFKGIDRLGGFNDVKVTGCYKEGVVFDFPNIGKVKIGSCSSDAKMCCCKKNGCNQSLEKCRAANLGASPGMKVTSRVLPVILLSVLAVVIMHK